MLSFFRNNSQSFALKLILWLVVLSFSVFGIQNIFSSIANPNYAVSVGKHQYSFTALDEAMRESFKNVETVPSLEIVQNAYLNQAHNIGSYLAATEDAYKKGFYASNDKIAKSILNNPEFALGGSFSKDQLNWFLSTNRITYNEYEDEIRDQEVTAQMFDTMLANARMPEAYLTSIRKEQELMYQNLKLKILSLAESDYQAQTELSDAEIEAYYNDNKEGFRINALKDVELVKIAPVITTDFVVSDTEVKEAYDQFLENMKLSPKRHISQFLVPEDKKDIILEKLQEGAIEPETLASEFDLQFQVLGTQTREQLQLLSNEVAEEIYSIEPKTYSKFLSTPFGLMLFYVDEIMPISDEVPQLEQMRPSLVAQIEKQKRAEVVNAILPEFNENFDMTFENIENDISAGIALSEIAKNFNTSVQQYNIDAQGLNADRTPSVIASNTEVLSTINAQAAGDIPMVTYETNENGLVSAIYAVAVTKEHESAIEPLADVKQDITNALLASKTLSAQKDATEKLLSDNPEASIDELAAKTKGEILDIQQTASDLARQIPDIEAIRTLARDTNNPPLLLNMEQGWAIAQVVERTAIDENLLDQIMLQVNTTLEDDYRDSMLRAFMLENEKNYKVKIQQGSIVQLADRLYKEFDTNTQPSN